jgi:hypothetical protein
MKPSKSPLAIIAFSLFAFILTACAPASGAVLLTLDDIPNGFVGPTILTVGSDFASISFDSGVPTVCNSPFGETTDYGEVATIPMFSGATLDHVTSSPTPPTITPWSPPTTTAMSTAPPKITLSLQPRLMTPLSSARPIGSPPILELLSQMSVAILAAPPTTKPGALTLRWMASRAANGPQRAMATMLSSPSNLLNPFSFPASPP